MARKKISLSYIPNVAERKASFKKRKKGLIKKVSELSTLCGIPACAVIYSDFDAEPTVWPSPSGAKDVLQRFMAVPEIERSKRMVNLESFNRQRIKKMEEKLSRLRQENKRKELEIFMYMVIEGKASIKDLDKADAPEMRYVVDQTLRAISLRMEELEKAGAVHGDDKVAAGAMPALTGGVIGDGFPWTDLTCGEGSSSGGRGGDGGIPHNPNRL